MPRFVAMLAVALTAACAMAADIGGVQIDDRATVDGRPLVLNGGGIRKRLVFKVYVASLYLPEKAADAAAVLGSAPRRIRLDLLRSLSADTFIGALHDGLVANSNESEMMAIEPGERALASIMKAFGQVKENDIVTLDFFDGATHVGLNGEARGIVPGEAFNRALTRIWIGDKPVQDDLKKALLSG